MAQLLNLRREYFLGRMFIYTTGCFRVIRPETILFKYQDINQKWHEEKFDGLLSRAIQHEMDHLNGVLIIDLVDEIQKAKVQKEVNKIKNDSISRIKKKLI